MVLEVVIMEVFSRRKGAFDVLCSSGPTATKLEEVTR